MRWVVISLVLHALALAWLAPCHRTGLPPSTSAHATELTPADVPADPQPTGVPAHPAPIDVEVVGASRVAGGGAPGARDSGPPRRSSRGAWHGLAIRVDHGNVGDRGGRGIGSGDSGGRGTGHGIGFGDGGGVPPATRDVPRPPEPIEDPVSKARPAKLVWPTRDEQVEDQADLFVARITVDEHGTVVGARMIQTRPGARGDDAASAIWRFRYLPALDARGSPIRSTFEQPFQVR